MTHFSDMTHNDRVTYFNFHGEKLARAWAAFSAATDAFEKEVRACEALEYPAASAADAIRDTAAAYLAEEVRGDLGL